MHDFRLLGRSLFMVSLLALASVSGACTSSTSSSNAVANEAGVATQPTSATLFSSSVTSVDFEIDYQTNAAPYTGSAGRYSDVWQIMGDNVARVFLKTPKTVTLPNTLDKMQELTDISGTSFTSDQILSIAAEHRDTPSSGSLASFYIVFLNGYYDDGTGPQDQVIGVSIGQTGVIAIFKPVITATESFFVGVSRYVEQSTLVHEFGHAIGLVNNGLPLQTPHQDTAHGNHCLNDKCVMFWENEGAESAATFAQQTLATGSDILFGSECLDDIDAAN